DEVEARQVSVDVACKSVAKLNFSGEPEATITRLYGLINRTEFQSFRTMEPILMVVFTGRKFKAQAEDQIAFFCLGDRSVVCCQTNVANSAAAGVIPFAAVVTLMFV